MKNLLLSTSLLLGFYSSTSAQIIAVSAETKQTIDTTQGHTTIGGYGNAYFQRNNNEEKAKMNFERLVLFTGHKFNKKFSFFSELEVEDAKVSGGEEGGGGGRPVLGLGGGEKFVEDGLLKKIKS